MKIGIAALLYLFSLQALSQKSFKPGTYGDCDQKGFSRYACNRIEFLANGTFRLHSYAHLAGWAITRGAWNLNGDTLILNSCERDTFQYQGTGLTDSVFIILKDSLNLIDFALVTTKSGEIFHSYFTNEKGECRIPRQEARQIMIIVGAHKKEHTLNTDSLTLSHTDTIYAKLDLSNAFVINNIAWLYRDDKLYISQREDGSFEPDVFYRRETTRKPR